MVEATNLQCRNIIRAHRLVETFKRLAVNQLMDAVEDVDLPWALAEIIELYMRSSVRPKSTTFRKQSPPSTCG